MNRRLFTRLPLLLAAAAMAASGALAQTAPVRAPDPAAAQSRLAKDYKPPADIAFRTVNIMSEGVRLHGEVYTPKSAPPGAKLPAVVMAHGWGGTAQGFRRDAEEIARAGYFVLVFDYRGWGESDPRVILAQPLPATVQGNDTFTAKVQAVRGYVDPWEQSEDWFNALNWISGEPGVDADRIGVRGSSYSGGIILHIAAHDDRVKALVSQVGGIASRPDAAATPKPGTPNYDRWRNRNAGGIAMARGQAGYPEPRAKVIGNLIGGPVGAKMNRWWPNEDARNVTAPALFVLAADEELVDNKTNGERAYERVRGPKKLVTVPGQHYAIYRDQRETAVKLAIAWFDEHLKGARR